MQKTSFDIPFKKFNDWFEKAQANTNIVEPTAMCLSTVNENNAP